MNEVASTQAAPEEKEDSPPGGARKPKLGFLSSLGFKMPAFLKTWPTFLKEEIDWDSIRDDESDYHKKHKKLVSKVKTQTYVILALTVFIIIGAPFMQPIHIHEAISPAPQKIVQPLVPLTEPNLTDQAILSWVATSITEILTFGFGDFDNRVISQKNRFTDEGWESFLQVLRDKNYRDDFKSRQLVLTSVPADSPVIVSSGFDQDMDETWVVEMPIVMTYVTNNNVRQASRSIIRLTVARVPSLKNKAGMGIKAWQMY